MRFLILVKQVPESQAVQMDKTTGTLIREAATSVINPLDVHALECACRLRDRLGGSIDCLCMGPPAAEHALREAIAIGADAAFLLSDRRFAGSDTWCTANTLAAAIRRLPPFDLILCGERATDGETGQTGPALAALLDLPVATFASQISREGNDWIIRRLLEHGYETVACPSPLVVCVLKEAATPGLPTLQGKKRARQAKITHWDAATLDLPADDTGLQASPTRVVKIFHPDHRQQGDRIDARDPDGLTLAVDRVITLLEQEGVL